MTYKNFVNILNKLFPKATFYYSEVARALGGIVTLWNPNKLFGESIFISCNFLDFFQK